MSDKKEHVKSWMNSWIVGGSFPGALMGVYNKSGEELFYHEVDQSILKIGEPKTYNRDSIFRIYSNTKPVTTVAALILMERGLLSLHDPISKFIPSFEHTKVFVSGTASEPVLEDLKTPLTIHHLMTHTSGIPYGIFSNSVSDQSIRDKVGDDWKVWFMNTELEVLCDAIAKSPLVFQPGTSFLYGLNTDILGRVIEVVSGLKLDEFFLKEIFTPLSMVDTGFFVPADKLHRLVECYDYVPVSHSYKPSVNAERQRDVKHTINSGGGGLVSTLGDYARFSRCLLNKGMMIVRCIYSVVCSISIVVI
jgi:CubicO group peptidase (beta-lactamase class C family)